MHRRNSTGRQLPRRRNIHADEDWQVQKRPAEVQRRCREESAKGEAHRSWRVRAVADRDSDANAHRHRIGHAALESECHSDLDRRLNLDRDLHWRLDLNRDRLDCDFDRNLHCNHHLNFERNRDDDRIAHGNLHCEFDSDRKRESNSNPNANRYNDSDRNGDRIQYRLLDDHSDRNPDLDGRSIRNRNAHADADCVRDLVRHRDLDRDCYFDCELDRHADSNRDCDLDRHSDSDGDLDRGFQRRFRVFNHLRWRPGRTG